MKPVQILLPYDLRRFVDTQCRYSHESVAAYVRRLIVEEKRRQEVDNGRS